MTYVELLIAEWGIENSPPKLQTCVRRVLKELSGESQLILRCNPRLQVLVLPESDYSVWAYFPVHRARQIVRRYELRLRPGAKVLLLISQKHVAEQATELTTEQLRDHLGHTLLYLRGTKSRNRTPIRTTVNPHTVIQNNLISPY